MQVCRGTSDLDRIEQKYMALEDRSNLCFWRHQIAIRVTWRQDVPHCCGVHTFPLLKCWQRTAAEDEPVSWAMSVHAFSSDSQMGLRRTSYWQFPRSSSRHSDFGYNWARITGTSLAHFCTIMQATSVNGYRGELATVEISDKHPALGMYLINFFQKSYDFKIPRSYQTLENC
jgi:hypothetical protein